MIVRPILVLIHAVDFPQDLVVLVLVVFMKSEKATGPNGAADNAGLGAGLECSTGLDVSSSLST